MRLPRISGFFETLETYRYSVAIGLLLLYFAPYLFPLGWESVGATWSFSAGFMFFLSLGMILTRDVWPALKRAVGMGIDVKQASKAILTACKEKGGNPSFEIKYENLQLSESKIREFIKDHLEHGEALIKENSFVITKRGLKKLKENI
jgi:hypothetical protein